MINIHDEEYMQLAIKEAGNAYRRGNIPIGAVLNVEGIVDCRGNNKPKENPDLCSHVGSLIIKLNAKHIREGAEEGREVELYTTLEPCSECLDVAVENRVGRIVSACPNPFGELISRLSERWGGDRWPQLESGLLKERAYHLLAMYMAEKKDFSDIFIAFERMQSFW